MYFFSKKIGQKLLILEPIIKLWRNTNTNFLFAYRGFPSATVNYPKYTVFSLLYNAVLCLCSQSENTGFLKKRVGRLTPPPPTTNKKKHFFSINGENSPGSCLIKILFYEVGTTFLKCVKYKKIRFFWHTHIINFSLFSELHTSCNHEMTRNNSLYKNCLKFIQILMTGPKPQTSGKLAWFH